MDHLVSSWGRGTAHRRIGMHTFLISMPIRRWREFKFDIKVILSGNSGEILMQFRWHEIGLFAICSANYVPRELIGGLGAFCSYF